jgi:hypothetical protein
MFWPTYFQKFCLLAFVFSAEMNERSNGHVISHLLVTGAGHHSSSVIE